ncbi:MAG: peptidylprolyl isomerase [Planctomycetota bacterium]
MAKRPLGFCLVMALTALGCQPSGRGSAPVAGPVTAAPPPANPRGEVVAYVGGETLRRGALWPAMVEAAGGSTLSEHVLDAMLSRRLATAGVVVGPGEIAAERRRIAASLADDEDTAARLLDELRRRRGWGPTRFDALLRRNAGLRALVADRVTVTDAAVRREHRLRFGPAYRVRLLMVRSLDEAQALRRDAAEGDLAFAELAAAHSIDPSAAQGGLLSPIRPDDTTYPQALRAAAARLAVGAVSPPVALDGGFALVYLKEKTAGQRVDPGAVRPGLEADVRRRAERVMMQQLARELIGAADVVVLDPALRRGWERQRDAATAGP